MSREAIGLVRIDFRANMVEFSKSLHALDNTLKRTRAKLDEWGTAAQKKLQEIERGARAVERAGKDLTKGVTLPILAIAAAAVKASDPTGKLFQRIKGLGTEALITLQPLGDAIIQVFDAAEPTIRRGIAMAGVVIEQFRKLSPEAQRLVVLAGAGAAALGPLLVGGAIATKAIVVAAGAMTKLLSVAKMFTYVLAPKMLLAAVAIGAAFAGWQIGSYLYDEFAEVQMSAAAAINFLENGIEYVSSAFDIAILGIREGWDSTMDFLLERGATVVEKTAEGLRWIRAISQEQLALAKATAAGMRTAYGTVDFQGEYRKIIAQRDAAIAFNDAVYQTTIDQIGLDFGGRDRKGQSFGEHMLKDMASLGSGLSDALKPLRNSFGEFMSSADRYASTSQERAAAWQKDAAGARDVAKGVDEASREFERLREDALRIRLEVYPEEKLQADIARIRELAAKFPEILDGPTVRAAIEDLSKKAEVPLKRIRKWQDEFKDLFKDFGRDASRVFANLATGAKVSFDEILTSWVQMAVEMAAQQWIFGPAFKAAGTSLFGETVESARGNVFSRGQIIPHAMGGVVDRESFFPMRRGIGSMAEGNKAEGILPLQRIRGRLGVYAAGAGGNVSVQIYDQRSGGQPVRATESRGPEGERILRILVRDEVGKMAGDGGLDGILGPTFGTRRRPRMR